MSQLVSDVHPRTVTTYKPGEGEGVRPSVPAVKEPITLPPEIEHACDTMKPVLGEVITQTKSVSSNPQPVTPIGVPAGPDHWDSSMSGVKAAGVNIVAAVVNGRHEVGANGMSAFTSIQTAL